MGCYGPKEHDRLPQLQDWLASQRMILFLLLVCAGQSSHLPTQTAASICNFDPGERANTNFAKLRVISSALGPLLRERFFIPVPRSAFDFPLWRILERS